MPIDPNKVGKIYNALKEDGYTQSYEDFKAGFYGNDHYANRKKVFDYLHENGAQVGNTYEEFMDILQSRPKTQQPSANTTPTTQQATQPQTQQTHAQGTTSQMWQPSNPLGSGAIAGNAFSGGMQPQWGVLNEVQRQEEGVNVHPMEQAGLNAKEQQEQAQRYNNPAAQQVRDELDYARATGGRSLQQDAGRLYDLSGNIVAAKLARDANGNMLMGDDGKPQLTFTTDAGARNVVKGQRELAKQKEEESTDKRLEALKKEQDKINAALRRRQMELMSKPGYFSALNTDFTYIESDPEYMKLMAASRKNRQAMQLLEDAKSGNTNSFFHTMGTTMMDGYTFTGGSSYIKDAVAMHGASKYVDSINRKLRSGEALTREEEASLALMKADITNEQMQGIYGDQYGAWARASKTTTGSVELVGDFLSTGGLAGAITKGVAKGTVKAGAKMLTKAAGQTVRQVMKDGASRALLKGTGILVGMTAGGATVTFTSGLGRTVGEAGKAMAGHASVNDKGELEMTDRKGVLEAVVEASYSGIKENGSEMAGLFMGGFGGAALKGLQKLGLSRVAGTLTRIGNKQWYKQLNEILEAGGYNGLPSEVLEEYVGYGYDMLFGHGKEAWRELKDPRTHLDIMLGCLTTGALMGAAPVVIQGHQTAQYYRYKNRLGKRDKEASATFGDAKAWEALRDEIDITPNGQMGERAYAVLNSQELTPEQKQAAMNYIIDLQRMRGYSIGVLNAEQEQAAEKGVQMDLQAQRDAGRTDTEPQQMNEQQMQMEVADAMMQDAVGADVAEQVRQKPEAIAELAATGDYTDEQLAAMRRYADASSHVSGIRERMQQEADAEVQQRMQQIESITNKDTGEIITVHETDVNGNPLVDEEGRSVMRHVTAGKLVLRADGTIDTDASTASVTLLNPTTGEVEMVSPSDIHAESIVTGSAEELRKASEASIRQEVAQRYDATLRGGNPDVSRGGAEFRIVGYDGTPCTVRLASGANGEAVSNTEGALLCDVVDEGNGQVAGQVNLTPSQLRDLSHRRAVQERIYAERSMRQQGATPASAAQPFAVGQSLTLSDGQGGVVRGDVIDDADENGRITVALDKPMPDGSETLLLSPEELKGMVVQEGSVQETEELKNDGAPAQNSIEIGSSLTEEQALALVERMEAASDVAEEIPLTIENWDALFGEEGNVSTPLGSVKMGENQFAKMMRQGRNTKLGMIKPTLESPYVIVEEESSPSDGTDAERGSSYVFIRSFKKQDGSRYYYFTSITVSKDGNEVVVSNQEKSRSKVLRLLQEGRVAWCTPKDATAASAERQGLDYGQAHEADAAAKGSGITPQTTPSSASKDTAVASDTQALEDENAASTVVNATQPIPVEKDKKGKAVRTLYHQVPLQRTLEDLYDGSLTQAEIDAFVDNYITQSRKRIESLVSKQPQIGTDKQAYLEEKARHQQALHEAQAELNYYEQLRQEVQRITQRTTQQQDNAASSVHDDVAEPASLAELAADFAARHKVTPESLKAETGMAASELKGYVGLVAGADKGGITIERMAEKLAESPEWEHMGGTPDMMQDARNMLIEAYLSGNPRSAIRQRRERMAREARERELMEVEDFAQRAYHMSAEEYLAYEEQAIPAIIQRYAGFDYDAYAAELSDEDVRNAAEYATLQQKASPATTNNTHEETNPITDNQNGQQAESTRNGAGSQVLPQQGTAHKQRNSTDGQPAAGQQAGTDNAWIQGNPAQATVGEEQQAGGAIATAKADATDAQGNPINPDGTLKLEKITSVDELTDEDFANPTRNVELPALPENVDKAIGAGGKPVVIKKNIFERNAARHGDLSADDSRDILKSALYNPNLYGQNQKTKRPYNWVVINTKDKAGNNRLVLLELSPQKENVEIVHWHYVDEKGLEKIKRQAEREDGQLLILPSETEEAGALSSPTPDLSSVGKDTQATSDVQAPAEEKSQEGQADGAMLYHKEADGAADAVTSEEAALRDALMGNLQEAGIEVVTDAEEAQRVLDEANGEARMQAKKRALETASLSDGSERSLTVVSSADGAKVLRNLDKAIQTLESSPTQPKTFVGDIANSLGAQRKGSKSEYATFETKNGRVVTIRLADHNATVSNFDRRGELDGISIVVSPKKSAGVTNDGEAHVVEYYYDAIKLRKADGKPLAAIVRAIKQALYSGEFEDTTGLAERQEVNARELRQSVGVKMQKKPMTAEEQKHKETQLSIIHDTNPAPDDYHTWVRSIDDILTLQEAIDAVLAEDPEYELSTYPDVSDDMIREALRTGRITIYSSKPIKNGVFVTPSMMQAMDYSGGTKVFSKEVPIGNVAWINTDEGQYAATSAEATSEDKEVRFFRTPDGHAYGFTVGGKIYIDPRIAKADTPIHEYTHLWSAAVRQGDAKAWADIVRLMQGTPLWDEVAQHYPELADDVDALAEEVLSHFSGRRGAERLREAQRAAMEQEGLDAQAAAVAAVERVRQALKRFWRKVADFFGRRFTTADEVADTVLADMLHGVKPAFDAKDGGVRYDANSEEASIVARAKADGTYMKAPNGQPSKLTPRQWVQVRTKAFKAWFGDWAKAARIEKLRKSEDAFITGKEIELTEDFKQNKRNALAYGKTLQGEYTNADTGVSVQLQRGRKNGGINEVLQHNYKDEAHILSVAAIPQVIEKSIYIDSEPNKDAAKNPDVVEYQHFVCGLKIGNEDYTVHSLVAVDKHGNRYYDHNLTQIEKTKLLDSIERQAVSGQGFDTTSGTQPTTLNGYKGKQLFELLKTDCSKVVDENGEPMVVYHGTQEEFNAFDKNAVRERGDGVKGFFFATAARRESVAGYYAQHGGSIMPVFLNLKRPLVLSTSETLEAKGIADGYDGIISTAARDSESRYYDYEQKRVATERLNKGDIVEIVAFEPSQIKSAEENVGTFDGSNPDIRYQFVGERGAAAMDKAEEASVRLDNLAVAREMEAEGKDAKAVKLATGWERGADGKWRYEIGNGKLKDGWREKARRVQGAPLHDVLDNPELFASYPDMRNVTVSLESLDDGTYGEYRPNSNTIALNDNVLLGMENVIAHEVQHAIQHIEGFATGGNLNSVRSIVKRIIDSNKDAAEYAREQYKHASRLELLAGNLNTGLYRMKVTVGTEKFVNQAVDAYWEAMNEIDSDPNAELVNEYPSGMSPLEVAKSAYHLEEAEKELKRLAEYYRDSVPEGNEQALETVNRLEKALLNYSNFQLYKMIAGEVEARNVAKRLDMSEEERRRTLAEETEDVARKDQIFLHDGIGVSLMGSRVDGRMEEVGKHYKNKSLGVNERKVVDVYSGASKNETITLMRDGKEHKVVMRQGTENNAGTKHSLLRHYGTGTGVISNEDILLVPQVIESGELEEKGKKRVYRIVKDGIRYTVLTEVKNGREEFSDFYSNKKGDNTSPSNTQLSARDYDVTTNFAAKVVETFENPTLPPTKNSETDGDTLLLREGDGVVSDAVLSDENDALGKMGIERTEEERAAFAERERARMERMAHRVAEELGLDEDAVQVVTDVNEIAEPKLRKAKGWFDPKTGKITVVIPNHTGTGDVLRTMLHEAVAHKGLRGLFGKRFDVFLDNVYAAADETVRRRISTLAAKHGWDFRRATEEYLAGLAEDMHFEHVSPSFWQKIKLLFLQMLDRLGIRGYDSVTLTDNELRYVLWRSYQHMAHAGRYRSMEEVADKADAERAAEEDAAMRSTLGVGEHSDPAATAAEAAQEMAADAAAEAAGMDVLLREGEEEGSEGNSRGAQGGSEQEREKALQHLGRLMGRVRGIMQEGAHSDVVEASSELVEALKTYGMYSPIVEKDFDKILAINETDKDSRKELRRHVDNMLEIIDKSLSGSARDAKKLGISKVSEELVIYNQDFQRKIEAIGRQMSKLRQALSAKRTYDKSTVNTIVSLARILLRHGMFDKMSSREVQSLLSIVNAAHGKKDLSRDVQRLFDLMTKNLLRVSTARLGALLSSKKGKTAAGAQKMGKLDAEGQEIADTVRRCCAMSEEQLCNLINDAEDRMDSRNEQVAEQAALEYTGLLLARQYAQSIVKSREEEKLLREEMKHAAGKVDDGTLTREEYDAFAAATEEAIRENRTLRCEAYADLISQLTGIMSDSRERAKQWRDAERERVNHIHHLANSDMQGRKPNEHRKAGGLTETLNNLSLVRFLLEPTATFEKFMRMLGSKHVHGEGYLYEKFVRGGNKCRENELRGYRDAIKALDAKAKEVLGVSHWSDIASMLRDMPTCEVAFMDGGERTNHTLTQGNLLYIYMVNKMSDGKMKLRKMGISEGDVDAIKEVLDPRFITLADWMQDEFLPSLRTKYNAVHKRMFGTSMASIDHYFPLRILSADRSEEVDVSQDDKSDLGLPSTHTGSIIKRTRNTKALDLLNTDAFQTICSHIQEMEHWSAYAEYCRDLNTLLSYKRFRNQMKNMDTLYGSGDFLWRHFRDVCKIAVGAYKPKRSVADSLMVNLVKGATHAKIAFRIYTALKQFLSMPAFMTDASMRDLAYNMAHPREAWTWCMENLPVFEERWKSRMSGDPRLMKTDVDWKTWRSNVAQIASRYGMAPNAFVDALTVCIGAHSIYQTRLRQYMKDGYSEEQAMERARGDASILYNQTQQSSEGMYLSRMQVDRTYGSLLFSVFRNSSMSYTRMMIDSLRSLRQMCTPGYKEQSIEFMTKQLIRDGLSPSDARSAAERRYTRAWWRNVSGVLVYGFALPLLWNMGAVMPYLLMGDDDDRKEKFLEDCFIHSLFGPVEGLTGGDVMSSGLNMLFGDHAGKRWEYLKKEMPFSSDLYSIMQKLDYDWLTGLNDIACLMVQTGFGFNPKTFTDGIAAVIDYIGCEKDLDEFGLLLLRLANAPASQTDAIYFDELGCSSLDASKMTPRELVLRYAAYKRIVNAPMTNWAYGDEHGTVVDGRLVKRGVDIVRERYSEPYLGEKDVRQLLDYASRFDKQKQALQPFLNIDPERYYDGMERLYTTYDVGLCFGVEAYRNAIGEMTDALLRAKTVDERREIVKNMEAARYNLLHSDGVQRAIGKPRE